ncbi:hypothetical protein TNCT_486781 [Trichonephila clavata]|uniref:Uncharacterized protein n=1 Tax=Trichonephila clavata TaxID=2740835 RepID=A0A8X6LLS8_TRICU|nr:hypothetical protein TNCT_486781 [Trichonephila clavata]
MYFIYVAANENEAANRMKNWKKSWTYALYSTLPIFFVFLFWGHIKNMVCENPIDSDEDLVARLLLAAERGVYCLKFLLIYSKSL